MILLTSTSDLVTVITASALNLDVHASFVDLLSGAITPGRTNTLISSIATTTVVGSPAASTFRTVKTIAIRNRDASASNAIIVKHTDGTNNVQLVAVTLLAGDQLFYNENDGWTVIDSGGGKKVVPTAGRLLKRSVILNGTTTFTTGPSTNSISVEVLAGGGAGGGCSSVASAAAGAGGGSAGGYAKKLFAVTPNTAYTVAVGAGGTGVSGAGGNSGGNSTFAVGATTVTANGGVGGAVGTATATLTSDPGAAGPAISTNGDINAGGDPGGDGLVLIVATPVGIGGRGGSTPYGAGGASRNAVGNGNAATVGFGGGGGGAFTGASTVRTGGNGANGIITVDEFS